MIPKTIHYCWFGRNPKPKLAKKCMRSWRRYCPDYEIIEWNEDNFDLSSAPLYVRQAYEAKKWAFVSDYVRLYAMVNFGGVYMDTDVELVKPLDKFLHHQAFSGFEDKTLIASSIMGCEKDFPLFGTLLHYYDDAVFLLPDGSLNCTPNVAVITDICRERGFVLNNSFQVVDGFAIYPKEYFCPRSYGSFEMHRTENTHAIHWYAASWLPEEVRRADREIHMRLHKAKQRQHRHAVAREILGDRCFQALKPLKNRFRAR